jgi:hypothetical protein
MEVTPAEIRQEMNNQIIRLNSLLLLAHEAGMQPQMRNMPIMHKDEAVAQVSVHTKGDK